MADFSITLNIEDAKIAQMIAALNWQWGEIDNGDGTTTPKTGAQLRAEFKTRSQQALRDVYARYQRHLRDQQAVDPDIGIT